MREPREELRCNLNDLEFRLSGRLDAMSSRIDSVRLDMFWAAVLLLAFSILGFGAAIVATQI